LPYLHSTQATVKLSDLPSNDETRGRQGCGAPAIAAKFNESMLSSPNDCKIKQTALHDAVASYCMGLLPSKRGCPKKVTLALCAALATQSAMIQVAGKKKASSVRIRALTNGLILHINWGGAFNTAFSWCKTRQNHPEILNPATAKKSKDHHTNGYPAKI
jgi:hypothetical protein